MRKGLMSTTTKHTLALTVALACLAPLVSAAEVEGTLKQGELSVGSDLTYPPYTYLDQKQPAGFDPEFIQLLGQQLGMKPRFLDTRFANQQLYRHGSLQNYVEQYLNHPLRGAYEAIPRPGLVGS